MSEVKQTKRTDIMLVDPRNIVIKEGFNVRSDMGDIQALSDSIVETGLQVPLKAKKVKNEDKYELVDGHRRMAAIQLAIENGHDIQFVEVLAFKGNEEDQVFAMIITGTGQKPLNEVEQAEAIKRLINFGYKAEEIARKIAKSVPQVYNLISLANVSKKIKDSVVGGFISGATVVQIIRQTDDSDEQLKMVTQAIEDAQKNTTGGDKPKKATAKNVAGLKRKSEGQKLSELVALLDEREVKNEKTELLAELVANLKDSSVEDLVKIFE